MTEPAQGHPVLTVIVVNYGKRELLDECLRSIEAATAATERACEVVVVDNGSADGSADMVKSRHARVRLIELDRNEGFAPAVQRAIEASSGSWVAIVNNDARVDDGALARLIAAAESEPRVGAVAPLICFAARPEMVNSAGLEIDRLGIGHDRLAGAPRSEVGTARVEVVGATGCAALYRREMLDDIGGFDASFFAYLEDADVAWRARMRGWGCLCEPRAVVYHHGSATAAERSPFKYFLVGRNRMRLLAKNAHWRQLLLYGGGMLAYDVAYVVFVAISDRTLAPLRGRLQGIREWRAYRRRGAHDRRPVRLARPTGWLGALRQRRAYARAGADRAAETIM